MVRSSAVLKKLNHICDSLDQDFPSSDLRYGNEFNVVYALEPLLRKHKSWENISNFSDNGFDACSRPISEDQRALDMISAAARGNYKSVIKNFSVLKNNSEKEIRTGF